MYITCISFHKDHKCMTKLTKYYGLLFMIRDNFELTKPEL